MKTIAYGTIGHEIEFVRNAIAGLRSIFSSISFSYLSKFLKNNPLAPKNSSRKPMFDFPHFAEDSTDIFL